MAEGMEEAGEVRATQFAKVWEWQTAAANGLENAISEFKAALPGWWFSVCECQVSCDATCAPTRESQHIFLASHDDRFDSGFRVDLPQPSTLADALRDVQAQALAAIEEYYGG